MTAVDLRNGWFCDHAPGRGRVVGAGLVGLKGKYYFEMQVVSASLSQIAVGICNASFLLNNPVQLDVSPPSPGTGASGAFLSFRNNGLTPVGWGYPGSIPTPGGVSTFTANDWCGIAVDTANSLLWWRNATASAATWWGGTGGGTPDPVTGTQGFSFDPATGTCPITGNIYIVAGGGNENVHSFQTGLMNFGNTAFAAAAPTGWSAWDTTTTSILNPVDSDSHIVLNGANMKITDITAISGPNQPTGFIRSNTSKQRT